MHGFKLLKEAHIPELNTTGRLFRHIKTGAQLLSLENEDENKVFGITFRTPPQDSTGIAHIMEHSVLCGSRKYPVKEPFVELMKGSLNTFLNAFTYPDKTCYPVASQNLQDFYNLIDVYLDAVFFPVISPYTFQQEAWHYELESSDKALEFKGVVYNEMKGNYSSPDNLIFEKSQQSLFPDNTYRFDSGGDPEHIPDLTYEQFKSFHEKYYHPSNAYIYFYGDDDPETRLRLLDEYLCQFEAEEVDSEVQVQPYLDRQDKLIFLHDSSESERANKEFITVNWLLPEVLEPTQLLSFVILAEILIGTPASPLRKALIDSGLGEDLTGTGLEPDLRQMFFSTGLKGVSPNYTAKVEKLILETLEKLAGEGIEPEAVAAAMNTVEFRLRENNSGNYPQGLLLMLRSLRSWLHNGDALAAIAFEQPLKVIKSQMERHEPVFEQLIKEYFLDNRHRSTVILRPDPEEGKRREKVEQERLMQARYGMSDEEIQQLVETTKELRRRQETPDLPEALASIPTLSLSDLNREINRIPIEVGEKKQATILYHPLFTNGILYLDVGLNLRVLPDDLLPYVPLFGRALLEMGTDKEDFVRLSQRIGRYTGGIRPTTFTSTNQDTAQATAWLFLRGKAVVPQTPELFKILQDVLLRVSLDNRERFLQIVLEEKASLVQQLIPLGHRIINRRLRSYFSSSDYAAEQMGGTSYLFFLRQLADSLERDWPAILAKLESVRNLLINRNGMILNATLDETNWQEVRTTCESLVEVLPAKPVTIMDWQPDAKLSSFGNLRFEGLTIPAQVNYVGKGADLYQLGYPYSGSLAVILNHVRTTWLWEKVRVQGGAYGVFCAFDHRSGVFTYLSYRDPGLLRTLEIYDQTGQFLHQLQLDEGEITRSIIGAIGEMDAYQLPDAKGYSSMLRYLTGDDDNKRQKRRDQIFATTLREFHAFGEVLDRMVNEAQVVVLGSEDSIGQLRSAQDGLVDVVKVL